MRILNCRLSDRMKALIIAGFISILMIIGIGNLSYTAQQRSVLDFDRASPPQVLSLYSLL